MKVLEGLRGKLGETTIKKYWRIVNPKTVIASNASTKNSNEYKHPINKLEVGKEQVTYQQYQSLSSSPDKTFVELFIKEWNIKIYSPVYFKLKHNVDEATANHLYQMQFKFFSN